MAPRHRPMMSMEKVDSILGEAETSRSTRLPHRDNTQSRFLSVRPLNQEYRIMQHHLVETVNIEQDE